MSELHPNLFNFSAAKILVVGEIILDTYWYGNTNRTSPEAPVPIAHFKNSDDRLAGAGHIAAIIKSLGANVDIISVVGQDAGQISELLTAEKIATNYLVTSDQKIKQRVRIVSQSQQLLRIDNDFEVNSEVNSVLADLNKQFCDLYQNYNTVIFYDYNGSLVNNNCFAQWLDLCKKANIKIIYSPANLKVLQNFTNNNHIVDYVILNQDHPALVNQTLVTNSINGIEVKTIDNKTNIKPISADVENYIGILEVLTAAFALSINTTTNIVNAATLASAALAYAARQFGQCLINIVELQLAYADYILDGEYNYLNLKQEIAAARKKNKKIVFANGCFDVLHVGHVAYLDMAKQRGDKLFVAINSDCSIKRLKGSERPINDLADRLLVLSHLSCQDWVVPFFTDTPEDFLRWLKPDLLVKGGDYTADQIVGHEIVHSYGGKTEIIKHPYNHISSTKIINSKDHV